MATQIYFEGSIILKKYIHSIDFTPDPLHGYKCMIMLHIKNEIWMRFVRGFALQEFNIVFGISSDKCGQSYTCIKITQRYPHKSSHEMKRLLNYIADFKIPIKWKEDRYGYQITEKGFIERTWELKPKKLLELTNSA